MIVMEETSKKDKKKVPVGIDLSSSSLEIEFAKNLAGNDKMQRDRAMRNVWRWLRAESEGGKSGYFCF